MRINEKSLSAAITLSLVLGVYGFAGATPSLYGAGSGSTVTPANQNTYLDKDGKHVDSSANAAVVANTNTYVTSDVITLWKAGVTDSDFMVEGGNWSYVYSGKSSTSTGKPANNTVTVDGAATIGTIYAGFNDYYKRTSEGATNNKVIVNNCSSINYVYGSYSTYGTVDNSSVTIKGGTVNKSVYGGYVNSGTAKNNVVTITGGTITDSVYGGYAGVTASNNTVTITGGTIGGSVYGGYAAGSTASDNIVNFGATDSTGYATITGDVYVNRAVLKSASGVTGGALNVYSVNNTIGGNLYLNGANVNFVIPSTAVNNDTMLTVKGDKIVDLSQATVKAEVENSATLNGTIYLLKTSAGITIPNYVDVDQNKLTVTADANNLYVKSKALATFDADKATITYLNNGKSITGLNPATCKVNVSANDFLGSTQNKLSGVTLEVVNYGTTLNEQAKNNDAAYENMISDNPAYSSENNAVIKLNEGAIVGQTEFVFENGVKTIHEKPNQRNATLSQSLSNGSSFARMEMNDIRKRLGDVRVNANTNSMWGRYESGRNEGMGVDQTFNKFQLGSDHAVSDKWRIGGAVSYTKSGTDYNNGTNDGKTYSAAAYGLLTGKNGEFLDLIARVGMHKNDIKAQTAQGSLNEFGVSVSAEVGKTYDLSKSVYVEPQAELTYTRTNGDDFNYDGRNYKLDDNNSFVGRIGFALGYKTPENKGQLYTRFSLLHEFSGDTNLDVGDGVVKRTSTVDGKKSWLEWAIGGQFNTSKCTYVYVDAEKTFRADINEKYRLNVGLRYSF